MTIPPILVLDRALRDAGIPIDGVGGDVTDRSTWRAAYQPQATPAQRAQGDALLLTFDAQDPTTVAEIKADLAASGTNVDLLQAMAVALWEAIPGPLLSKAQLRARILALYRATL